MRNSDGRYPIAGIEPESPIVEVAEFTPRRKPEPPRAAPRPSSTRAKFDETTKTIVWDCSGGLPDKRLYDGVLGDYRTRYGVHSVVIYFDQGWLLDPRMDGAAIRHTLAANGFERELGRQYWMDFPLTPDPGDMLCFVCREPHQWRTEPIKKQDTRPDNRPAEEKIAEANEFAKRLEVAQKIEDHAQRAWAARIEQGQIL
jgi:hypothetical protein